jgi:hypothetical protein
MEIKDSVSTHKNNICRQLLLLEGISEKIPNFSDLIINYENLNDIQLPTIKNTVYYWKVQDFGSCSNALQFSGIFDSFKKQMTELKLPQVNTTKEANTILYIGKSEGPLHTRIKQHLGLASKRLYAMHLNQWLNINQFIGLKIKLYYTHLDFESFGIKDLKDQKDILELFETSLHNQYKPILGRTGH